MSLKPTNKTWDERSKTLSLKMTQLQYRHHVSPVSCDKLRTCSSYIKQHCGQR